MPASRGRWAAALLALVVIAGLSGRALNERRWSGPLYCIEKPGTVWNGLAPLPTGYTPECPESRTYRQEVRSGFSRVESYRTSGWQPKALLETLKAAGFRQTTDGYTLQYLATLQEGQTVVTLSGRP
jgi:hypothetical protein